MQETDKLMAKADKDGNDRDRNENVRGASLNLDHLAVMFQIPRCAPAEDREAIDDANLIRTKLDFYRRWREENRYRPNAVRRAHGAVFFAPMVRRKGATSRYCRLQPYVYNTERP